MTSSRLDRPPLKLLFGTPEFISGSEIQTTVRVGPKWRDDLKGLLQPRVPVFEVGKESDGSIGTATITGTLFGSFKDYAKVGSLNNHQKNCRTVKGLAKVLSECYTDFDPETSQVTVIFFKFTPNETVETTEEVIEETTNDDEENAESEENSEQQESEEQDESEDSNGEDA